METKTTLEKGNNYGYDAVQLQLVPLVRNLRNLSVFHSTTIPFGNPIFRLLTAKSQFNPIQTRTGRPSSYNNLPYNSLDEPYHIDVPGKQPRRVVSKTRGKPTPHDLAERPRTWRADYSSPSNTRFSKWLGEKLAAVAVARENAVFRRKSGQKRIQANPCLGYPGSKKAVYLCDLRQPSSVPYAPPLDYPAEQIYGFQLATSPPVHHLRAWHPLLPWYIDIKSTQPNGITIFDFCIQLFEQLHKRIGAHDMFNIELTANDRDRLQDAHTERCNGNISALKRGILRVDFLGRQSIFVGLQRGKHGLWEIKTREPSPYARDNSLFTAT
ncbi:uncharacterized protein LACBIDRAFT_334363 [Laccaria bicolor S238N-H82]|uniref:Predicted protein n=1 Tax=Laccaria bicolor (strain S238N-H82 / ATCC MYA-4686) TaxID=486041 RepID=B0DYZ1_LACBS|nr:uncharacterized protein LACBIDRAFT_334363 [Laccaria bicolor S238N-H82]EDR00142.1 predicted protein [Laccaria bicolor S238N-H82]|eukprot:XP_001889199.1 predicted protein [Laccaria bicolor S238N-H82]